MNVIDLLEKFDRFSDHWSPRIIGELNDQYVKIARIREEFIWHQHEHEDELFFVVKGTLIMDFRDRTVEVAPGQLLIVPRGTEHRPRTNGEEVLLMLIEPKSTVNTGNVESERTKVDLPWV